MIERIVLFKLKDEYANERARAEIADHSRKVLGAVPGVKAVSVGVPADAPSEKSWDLSLVLQFATLEAVEAYREHPDHRSYVNDYMRPRMEVIKAWNFSA